MKKRIRQGAFGTGAAAVIVFGALMFQRRYAGENADTVEAPEESKTVMAASGTLSKPQNSRRCLK